MDIYPFNEFESMFQGHISGMVLTPWNLHGPLLGVDRVPPAPLPWGVAALHHPPPREEEGHTTEYHHM